MIGDVSRMIGEFFGRRIQIVPSEPAAGGANRRCPDLTKIVSLGYVPKYLFRQGLPLVARWYDEHAHRAPDERSLLA